MEYHMSNEKNNTCSSAGCGSTEKQKQEMEENESLRRNLDRIANRIIVLSGKGGVGKSTVSVNLAVALAEKKYKTGLLDIDIHGPSVPKMLGLEKKKPQITADGMQPVEYNEYLKVMSIGFLLNSSDDAVIWRGPMKMGVIKQFLKDVEWGDLDYLVVDSPPGTGDEPLSIAQLIDNPKSAVIVTTPQDVALTDVRKSVSFCRQINLPILGVVENMSGFACPHCGKSTDIFKTGGGSKMADDMGVQFLGEIPLESQIVENGDTGKTFTEKLPENSSARQNFNRIVEKIIAEKKKLG